MKDLNQTYNLFLDDFRFPYMCLHYMANNVYGNLKWEIVRSHEEFVKFVTEKFAQGELPLLVSYDHDLADAHYDTAEYTKEQLMEYYEKENREMTGYDSAKWFVDFCIENKIYMSEFLVHSMNMAGRENIKSYLRNFKIHQSKHGV